MCLATAKNKDRCGTGGNKALKKNPDPSQQKYKDSAPQEVRRNGPTLQLRTLRL